MVLVEASIVTPGGVANVLPWCYNTLPIGNSVYRLHLINDMDYNRSNTASAKKRRNRKSGRRSRRSARQRATAPVLPYATATTTRFEVSADLQLSIATAQSGKITFNTRTILGTTVYAPLLAFYDNIHTTRCVMDLRPISSSSTTSGELLARCSPDDDPQQAPSGAQLLEILGTKRLKLSSPGKLMFSWKPRQPDQMALNDTNSLFNLYFGILASSVTPMIIEIRFRFWIDCSEPINNSRGDRGLWRSLVQSGRFETTLLDLADCFEEVSIE